MIQHFHYTQVTSTNDTAKDLIQAQEGLPFVLTADHQTKGRGTRHKHWYSDPGKQLLYTLCMKHKEKKIDSEKIILLTAKKIKQVIQTQCQVELQVQWPNDLLLNNKKCAGILVENRQSKFESTLIIGIGLNMTNTEFPEALRHAATSILLETGRKIQPASLVMPLSEALIKGLESIEKD